MVRFHFWSEWETQGVRECASLFKEFLRDKVNANKILHGSDYETVIQAASFSEDVARVALLEMEKEHFDGEYAPHHCRLLLALDAQFDGANVPLASQYLAMSNRWHVNPIHLSLAAGTPLLSGTWSSIFVDNILYEASRAKGALQTLRYSGWAGNNNFPFSPWVNNSITPGHHDYRRNILNIRIMICYVLY